MADMADMVNDDYPDEELGFVCMGCGERYEELPTRGRCHYCGEPVVDDGEDEE